MAGEMNSKLRRVIGACAIGALAFGLAIPEVDARAGGGGSSGSRGGSTFSAPPSTSTAPRDAQPMQRTETPSVGASRPGMAAPAAPSRGLGFGGGLVAGMLGAGVLGMLFGGGFFGGLSGLSSIMGLLFQVLLIGGLVWLALRFFRRRSEPVLAGAGAPYARSALGSVPGGGQGRPMGGGSPARQPVEIGQSDYRAFERMLHDVQIAYGRGDASALQRLATPEMARYFEQDLAENRARGVRNEVADPKLLQGDLAEAWREGSTDYATVAMRFEITEAYVEIASGKVVSGNRTAPTEATELWTFRRDGSSNWTLSAIQQTG